MPFTIEATISESSTTRVYRAFDETLHRRVLLKVLHRHLAHDEQVRQRFVREARACAALRSEYIVQVFDLTEVDGAPAIVMEYVDGMSLKELIADESKRTFALASTVALHVLRGLSAAHAQQIIHRDIKPGNIMVDVNGTVKIERLRPCPYFCSINNDNGGNARGDSRLHCTRTDPWRTAGRPRRPVFTRCDLVETLSGERLFEGATYAECLNKVSSFKSRNARPVYSGVVGRVRGICQAADASRQTPAICFSRRGIGRAPR